MSAAYDALLACQNPTFVVLAEVQPAQELGPWSADTTAAQPPSRQATSGLVTNAASSTISASVTSSGLANDIIIARGILRNGVTNPSFSSVTLDGVAMTKLAAINSSNDSVEIWYALAPAAGAHTVLGTSGTTNRMGLIVEVWNNVSQSSPFGTAATATSGFGTGTISAVATSSTSQVVIDIVAIDVLAGTNDAPAAGQTSDGLLDGYGGGSHKAGAASVTMTWTWTAGSGGAVSQIAVGLKGANPCFKATWSNTAATDVVPGGIYRRLDQVRQDATKLTSVASNALCQTMRGSYYFDSANSLIYVNTTTGSSPETFAFVGAWFTVFFASQSVSFSDQPLYEPRLTTGLPTLEQEKPDTLFGATISDSGNLVITNTDKLFDKLSKTWDWRNKLVKFKLGGTNGDTGVALAYSDYAAIGAMTVNTATPDDEVFTLQLDTIGSVLNQSIPLRTVVTQSTLADPAIAVTGQTVYIPYVLGTVKDCKATLVDQTPGLDWWMIADEQFSQFDFTTLVAYAISKTTGARSTISGGDLSPSSLNGMMVILVNSGDWPSANYDVWVDGNSSVIASTGGSMLVALLEALGVDSTMINTAAFAALDALSPTLGVFITQAIQAADVVRVIEQSINAQVYITTAGVWTCRVFDPSTPTTYTLSDADFMTWEPEEDLSAALNEVRVQYDARHASGAFSEASASSDAVKYSNETFDSTSLATYIRNSADASNLAGHDLFLKSSPPCRVTTEQRGLGLMSASVGDMVAVTRARGPIGRTGQLDGQVFEIVKITKSLGGGGGVPTVTVVLDDIGGQTDRIFRLSGSGDAGSWAAASAADKAIYGFLSDDNGYIDSTDITTKNLKVLV